MNKVFYNILLPVFLKKETEDSVAKAVNLANKLECNLHIIHTIPSSFLFRGLFAGVSQRSLAERKAQLFALQHKYEPMMRSGSLLITQFRKGDPLEQTVAYALAQSIDLICYDESPHILSAANLNIQRLSERAPCPVLAGGATAGRGNVDKIVLPIDEHLSAERVRVAIFMAQQLGAAIHLVGGAEDADNPRNMIYLKKAYELLKDNTSLDLVCSTFSGNDSALDYAQSVSAGLIVVNRDNRARKTGLGFRFPTTPWNRSRIPVLLV